MDEVLLEIDLDLPDHSTELEEVDEYIKNLKQQLAEYKENRIQQPMSLKQYTKMYDEIVRGLFYLGNLSLPAFATEDIIEKKYFEIYKHAPELAKKLWWDHYESVHRPYTLFKNRLFKMIEDLNDLYILIHKCPPPDYVE
jgi:hypothetical protein